MAKVVQQEQPQFDWELFGAIIRKSRTKMGYNKADVFCESVFYRARVNISPVTYYRIETGKQEPTAVQLFGICMALYGEPFPQKIFDACASDEWKAIEETHEYRDSSLFSPARYDIPSVWKYENFEKTQEAASALGKKIENKNQAAIFADGGISWNLFEDEYPLF